jgi:hypothetical protein
MLGTNSTVTALGSKLDLGCENSVNNGLNCNTSSEAKVKAINTTYDTKQVTTELFAVVAMTSKQVTTGLLL